jgi:hypothetical protein
MNSPEFVAQAVSLAPEVDLRTGCGREFLVLGLSELSGRLAMEVAAGTEHHGRVVSAASFENGKAFVERMRASNGRALRILGDMAWYWALCVAALGTDPIISFGGEDIQKKFRESRIFGASHPMAGKLGYNGVVALSLLGNTMNVIGWLGHLGEEARRSECADGRAILVPFLPGSPSLCLSEFADSWRLLVAGVGGDAVAVLAETLSRHREPGLDAGLAEGPDAPP